MDAESTLTFFPICKEIYRAPQRAPSAWGGYKGADSCIQKKYSVQRRESVSPEVHWALAVEWQNAAYELFMEAQRSMGRTDEEAHALLKRIWEREDRERMEALRQSCLITSRAG